MKTIEHTNHGEEFLGVVIGIAIFIVGFSLLNQSIVYGVLLLLLSGVTVLYNSTKLLNSKKVRK